ncbi:putative ABC transport system ATP-binding protein [Neolewinella xylanilytica]|uniref:Putative ABC transport system ATP-binding protein n=1 Tax=Neolewinella xylanilytica TaxID=1514080 RepID=A0A2S6I1U6_9BACT|nr:ATP-binding cassette domain-containing protein [Neolewinella xylanilytica]PPK85157.1 putative ABC transport system ATP-binding protein [Neolewinella xylanilytica]
MLTTHDLSYRYGAGAPEFAFPDLSVEAGEGALLLGPSGSGKSTWLHLLAGILSPLTGRVELDGTVYGSLRSGDLDRFRGRNIGLVLQRAYFVEALNVAENLALARKMAGLPPDRAFLLSVLESLGIGRYAQRKPRELSVGEQQRVTIARALVNRPKLILADEPTSALDDPNAHRVSQLLRERAAELGAALVVVTHDGRLRTDFSRIVAIEPLTTQNI